MDLEVDIEKVILRGVDRFKLSCKAEVGTTADRESLERGPKSVNSREEASLPTLTFRFQNTNPTASLFFTFLDINGAPDQTELGSCLVRLILDPSHCSPSSSLKKLLPEPLRQVFINRSQDQTWVPLTKQLHIALVSSKIAGTELSKCIGKLRFTVTHSVLVMGSDIRELRKENQLLRKETEQLQTKIHEMESRAITSMSKQRLESLSKADLIQMIGNLEGELQSKKSYQGKVQHLKNELIKKNEIEARYIELQEAHTAQQKLVQDLQSKIKKCTCMQMCRQQEATVTQLQAPLAQQAQGQGYTDSALLTRENAQLRREDRDSDSESFPAVLRARDDTIQSLKAELSSKCQELESQESQICKLKQQLIEAEMLMAKIQENASKSAKEKTCYGLQLVELRRHEPCQLQEDCDIHGP